MTGDTCKLLTVVTESVLEPAICEALGELGAKGYTVTDARGSGSRGVRDARWSSTGNVRIEVVCDAAVARKIAAYLKDRFYADYAMVLFIADVEVLRPTKFARTDENGGA